jgi:hypothetical protein
MTKTFEMTPAMRTGTKLLKWGLDGYSDGTIVSAFPSGS